MSFIYIYFRGRLILMLLGQDNNFILFDLLERRLLRHPAPAGLNERFYSFGRLYKRLGLNSSGWDYGSILGLQTRFIAVVRHLERTLR